MTALLASPDVAPLLQTIVHLIHPLLLGLDWMDPNWLLDKFGNALFWISLVIVFIECGLLFPILPGDTLLFGLGLFIAAEKVDLIPGSPAVELVFALVTLTAAGFLGNVSGYEIGRFIGPTLYDHDGRLLRRKHLDQTSEFFDRHGSKALVIGRFVPFVRTFITVVAGVTEMNRGKFLTWSALGAVLWVLSVTLLGYFLGSAFPSLGENIDKAIIVLLAFSLVPVVWEWWRHHRHASADGAESAD